MKDYGKTRSTVKPDEMVIDDSSVWVCTDIVEVSEEGTDDMDAGFIGYEFNMVQYSKDEFIKIQADKNSSLENELTETQLALCDVYEMIGQ